MDPLSAFSLACGVIQVVDFSTKVVKRLRELYKDGSLSQNEEAEEMATQLTQLQTNLNLPNHRDQAQDELLKLGEKCSATAKDLVTELQKLKISGPHRKGQAFQKTIKTIWKKTAIDDIQKRLDDYRKLLDHRVLIDIRKRFDLTSIQQREGLTQGPKTVDELKALIQDGTQSMKEHVTKELQQQQIDLAQKEYRQRFLDSLWFREIHRRQEIIHEAHEKTFQWIYEPDESDKGVRQWSNFAHWLESGQYTYWINGKAGSGKSTLMNYIIQDDRTAASLKVWAGSKEIFTPGFFFWDAGEDLEKSAEGLLRSLIYQLLKRFPRLTPPSQIASYSESMQKDPRTYEPIAAWTERRLHATFEMILRQAQEKCRICVFIDGLDEFVGDQDILIKLIEKVQTADVKVCLSSRPYRSYNEAFGSSAKLQLQDLTNSDIRKYVSDKLYPLVKRNSAKEIYDTFDTIVHKAEGVFLWVELVVKDLINGLRNEDTLEQLRERLDSMPSDIQDLYTHMLSKIDKVYQTQAAKLFRMALLNLTDSLLIIALALFRPSKNISDMGLSDMIAYGEGARKKIPTICAGLLEVNLWERSMDVEEVRTERAREGTFRSADPSLSLTIQYAESSELADVEFLRNLTHVEFIHRTARDYLEQSEQGKRFLDTSLPPDFDPYSSHINALLSEATMLGFAYIGAKGVDDHPPYDDHMQDNYASWKVFDIMTSVCSAEQQGEIAQISLCDDIDRTLGAIHHRHGLPSPKILGEIMENISVAERQNGTAQVSICAEYDNILADTNRQLSPKKHWSVQWGMWRDWFITGGGEISEITRSGSSSHSNSTDSFHSANSSRVLPTRPMDFIGFASLWGLSHYVEQRLRRESRTIDQDTADYLLCCSIWGFHFMSRRSLNEQLRLFASTAKILRLGGDCNIYVKDLSNTLWGDFLTQMTRFLRYDEGDVEDYERSDIERVCAMTTKAFLEHGADVHVRAYREVVVKISGLGSLDGQVARESEEFTCMEESSALYAIQESFGDIQEFEILKKQIMDKGGNASSRWTHIALNGSRPYKISEQQSHDFKAAFRGYGVSDDGRDESVQKRRKWALQIAKLCKESFEDEEYDKRDFLDGHVTPTNIENFGSLVEAHWRIRIGEKRDVYYGHPIQI